MLTFVNQTNVLLRYINVTITKSSTSNILQNIVMIVIKVQNIITKSTFSRHLKRRHVSSTFVIYIIVTAEQ